MSRMLQLVLLVVAVSLASAGALPVQAQDEDVAQFEIDDGKLQLSIYTSRGDDFTEVIADPKNGAVVKAEKITDSDDLNDAVDQKAAMDKATVSLLAAADTAEKDNPGSRVVGIFPDLRDGHAVAEVTLLQGEGAKKVTEKLD